MLSLLGMLASWTVLAVMCQASDLEHSGLSPLSIVYTVYPYYDSERVLAVLRAEEALRVTGTSRIIPLDASSLHTQPDNTRDNSRAASETPDSSHNDSNETRHRAEQPAEITYWPPIQRGATPKTHAGRAIPYEERDFQSAL